MIQEKFDTMAALSAACNTNYQSCDASFAENLFEPTQEVMKKILEIVKFTDIEIGKGIKVAQPLMDGLGLNVQGRDIDIRFSPQKDWILIGNKNGGGLIYKIEAGRFVSEKGTLAVWVSENKELVIGKEAIFDIENEDFYKLTTQVNPVQEKKARESVMGAKFFEIFMTKNHITEVWRDTGTIPIGRQDFEPGGKLSHL